MMTEEMFPFSAQCLVRRTHQWRGLIDDDPVQVSSALGGTLLECMLGALSETVHVFVVSRTREKCSPEIEVLPMRIQHHISSYNKVDIAAKMLLEVILPGQIPTPRTLGTTRL